MAKVNPSPLISSISGSVGELTFRDTKAGLVLGAKQGPLRQSTPAQITQQAAVGKMRVAWANLTNPQRDSWNALAQRVSKSTIYSGKMPARAYALFLEYNALLAKVGGGFLLEAPTDYKKATPKNLGGILFTAPLAVGSTSNYDADSQCITLFYLRMGMRGRQRSALCPKQYLGWVFGLNPAFNMTSMYLTKYPTPVLTQTYQFSFTYQQEWHFPVKVVGPVLTVSS